MDRFLQITYTVTQTRYDMRPGSEGAREDEDGCTEPRCRVFSGYRQDHGLKEVHADERGQSGEAKIRHLVAPQFSVSEFSDMFLSVR